MPVKWIANHLSYQGEDFVETVLGIFSSREKAVEVVQGAFPQYVHPAFNTPNSIWFYDEPKGRSGSSIRIDGYEEDVLLNDEV